MMQSGKRMEIFIMEIMQMENVKGVKLSAKGDVNLHAVGSDGSDWAKMWLCEHVGGAET